MAASPDNPQKNIEVIAKTIEQINRRGQTEAQKPGKVWESSQKAQLPTQITRQLEMIAGRSREAARGPNRAQTHAGGTVSTPGAQQTSPAGPALQVGPADKRSVVRTLVSLLASAVPTGGRPAGVMGPEGMRLRRALAAILGSALPQGHTPSGMRREHFPGGKAGGLNLGRPMDPNWAGMGDPSSFGSPSIQSNWFSQQTQAKRMLGRMAQHRRNRVNPFLGRMVDFARERVGGAVGGVGAAAQQAGHDPAGAAAGGLKALAGVLPGPVGMLARFGGNLLQAGGALKTWGRNIMNANFEFAQYSASMAGVASRQKVRDIMLSRQRGERRAGSAEYQAQAVNRFEKFWSKIEDTFAKGWNYVSGFILNQVAAAGEVVESAGRHAEQAMDRIKEGESDIAQEVLRGGAAPGLAGMMAAGKAKRQVGISPDSLIEDIETTGRKRWQRFGRPIRFDRG